MRRLQIYCAFENQVSGLLKSPYNLEIPTIRMGMENAENAIQPAIFIMPNRERSTNIRGLPNKWTLLLEVYVYVKRGVDDSGVANLLALIDAIDTVTSPEVNNRGPGSYANDLGLPNIVSSCAIAGEIQIFGGYLTDQSIALIPFEIVTVG